MHSIVIPKGAFCTVDWSYFGQRGNFEQFFNIQIVSVQGISQLGLQSCHVKIGNWTSHKKHFIYKFFLQRQYKTVEKFSKVALLSKVAPVDGTSTCDAI